MKVALVHDHLAQDGGAEKVLQSFQELFPLAPTYVVVYDPKNANASFARKDIRTSFIQNIPGGMKHYQWFLALMPAAVEHYDLSEYDVVLSTSSSFAKGVITQPGTVHVNYCHTPTRFLWTDTHSYLRNLRKPRWAKMFARMVLPRLRQWDYMAAQRPDVMIANSHAVQDRIKKYYHRDVDVIYPPVALERFAISDNVEPYFLTGGRLVAYKSFDLVIRAFNELGMPLKVYGDGPELGHLKKCAGPTVELLGRVSDDERRKLYAHATAFINAQEEDFGITPIESMASGRPVIAYAAGGALETVEEGVSGIFFHEQSWEALADKVVTFKPDHFDPEKVREHAQKYSDDHFKARIKEVVMRAYAEHQSLRNRT